MDFRVPKKEEEIKKWIKSDPKFLKFTPESYSEASSLNPTPKVIKFQRVENSIVHNQIDKLKDLDSLFKDLKKKKRDEKDNKKGRNENLNKFYPAAFKSVAGKRDGKRVRLRTSHKNSYHQITLDSIP